MLHEWTNTFSHFKKRVSSSPQSTGAGPTEPTRGHYTASKLWDLTTHRCSVTSQRNGNLSFYCPRMPLYQFIWIRFYANLAILANTFFTISLMVAHCKLNCTASYHKTRNPVVGEVHRSLSPTVVVASVVPEVLEERPSLDNHLDQTECHILLSEHEMLVVSLFIHTYLKKLAKKMLTRMEHVLFYKTERCKGVYCSAV